MTNITINSLPTASTIDPTQDILPIYTAASAATQGISRNVLLGLSSAPVGVSDSQTLSNKILTSPTINGATLSGTLSGTYTLGGTPTFPSSVATLTGAQTLTNKVLTSPTINTPTITNASITADTLSGFTTSNNGTIYGIAVTGGTIGSAAIASGAVGTSQLATNAVAAANLATNAITLGYAQITSAQTSTSGTGAQISGLSVTVTIPSGGRKVKITVYSVGLANSASSNNYGLNLWDGTVGSGTQLQASAFNNATGAASAAALGMPVTMVAITTPAAGSKTYNVGGFTSSGTLTVSASATAPAFILVEAI